ncbi:hypothetical protein Tco_0696063 [Tanacetum coccineum]
MTNDDDDEESSIHLKDIISELPLSIAITPDFLNTDSLIMEDEHLDTILETESDEENEPSVEDLNLTPSESEDLSDIESECDMPVCDDSSPNFTTFSNPLFDSNDDFTSSDDESITTVNQGMSVEEIKWVVAQRVANAIEAIAIYETKTNMACKSMSQNE